MMILFKVVYVIPDNRTKSPRLFKDVTLYQLGTEVKRGLSSLLHYHCASRLVGASGSQPSTELTVLHKSEQMADSL